MVTRTPARGRRPAAVNASTVFAIALAIVAGLIFAWLFKVVLFSPKPPVRPVDNSVEVTVAANNIYDKTQVLAINVKKVRISPEQYAAIASSGRRLLTGNQPVGRVTKVPVLSESPFYDDDLLPYQYPESVAKKIRPGYRAVVVTVPAKEAMVQTDDWVDVYCTLSNDALGAGGNGTAEIAHGVQVVARFGTTRPGAQPANVNAPREYTLEVTPYRFALIELAKTVGAKFSLGVAAVQRNEEGQVVSLASDDPNDARERSADRVNGGDLAALFGITGPGPSGPGPWEIEKYVGIHRAGSSAYPGYVPVSRVPLSGGGGGLEPVSTPGAGKKSKPVG